MLDATATDKVFAEAKDGGAGFDAVMHFAGLKAVGESVEQPIRYYDNNITGTLNLLKSMQKHDVKKIVFSSSATVYGDPGEVPADGLAEDLPTGQGITNPYGRTKYMIEEILKDACVADGSFSATILRYFNPVGAHKSGKLGEDPNGRPNNLMPIVMKVAQGVYPELSVYGNDYPTPDGTCVRDYIHVVDLAKGHVAAIRWTMENQGAEVFNLGTGTGYSVLDMVHAFIDTNRVPVPYEIVDRRPGDIGVCYADPAKSAEKLGWKAEKNLNDMVRDAWRWQSTNPMGYGQ